MPNSPWPHPGLLLQPHLHIQTMLHRFQPTLSFSSVSSLCGLWAFARVVHTLGNTFRVPALLHLTNSSSDSGSAHISQLREGGKMVRAKDNITSMAGDAQGLPKPVFEANLARLTEFIRTHSYPHLYRLLLKECSRRNGTKPWNFNYNLELQMWVSQSLQNVQNWEITMAFAATPGVVVRRSTQTCTRVI